MLPNIDFIKTVLNAIDLQLNKALALGRNSLLKVEQNLTESEKEVARRNIGAASTDNISVLTVHALTNTGVTDEIDCSFAEIQDAILSGRQVQFRQSTGMYPLIRFAKGINIMFGDDWNLFAVSKDAPVVTRTRIGSIRLLDVETNRFVTLRVKNRQISISSY